MSALSFVLQRRWDRGLLFAFIFLVLLVMGWLLWPQAFFRAYWFSLMFLTQLSIGALIVLLLQYLTGGQWGRVAVPFLCSVASGLYFLIPLFVPPLLALPFIFSWTTIQKGVSAPTLLNKEAWLNPEAFILRTLVYLIVLALLVNLRRRPVFSSYAGPFLVVLIILISFCSADWMMSLQPTFYSSLYPFLYFSGAMVVLFSLLSGTMAGLQKNGMMPVNPSLLLAYGKLLFTSVLFWGYIVFCQFIIIWTGNLPDEAEWYIVRSEPSWLWFTLSVLAGHFAIPFLVLLSQRVKTEPSSLLKVSALLVAMHFLEVFWLMRPTPGSGFEITVFDFLVPAVMGFGWLLVVLGPNGSFPDRIFNSQEVANET